MFGWLLAYIRDSIRGAVRDGFREGFSEAGLIAVEEPDGSYSVGIETCSNSDRRVGGRKNRVGIVARRMATHSNGV